MIAAPGKSSIPSVRGGVSSQAGTSAMRARPLRILMTPSQRRTCLRICWMPWPRPESGKRVRPWMNAASSAVASP